MQVKDVMVTNVLTITPGRSLREAARFMVEHNVGAVVILDAEQPGPGIVTERDLVRSLGSQQDPDQETVGDHLTAEASFADAEWGLDEAADAMAAGGFRHLDRGPRRRARGDHLDARHHARVAAEPLSHGPPSRGSSPWRE